MASYNRVVLVGNVARDVPLRYTNSGVAVTDVDLAVNDRRKDPNGDGYLEETCFVSCTFFDRQAEVCAEYLVRGSLILVEGRLRLDKWTTDSGENRSKLRVAGSRMQMLGRPANGSSSDKSADDADQTTEGTDASVNADAVADTDVITF